jgi:hypothetical protein
MTKTRSTPSQNPPLDATSVWATSRVATSTERSAISRMFSLRNCVIVFPLMGESKGCTRSGPAETAIMNRAPSSAAVRIGSTSRTPPSTRVMNRVLPLAVTSSLRKGKTTGMPADAIAPLVNCMASVPARSPTKDGSRPTSDKICPISVTW